MARAKLDISALAEKLSQLNNTGGNSNSSGMSFLTIKDGRNVLRLLPAREGADMFYEESWVHYGVGKSKTNKNGTMITCPTTHDENAACPVCEVSKEFYSLSTKKDDDYAKQAKALFRKKRVYFNVLSRDEDLSEFEKKGEGDDAKWHRGDKEESPVKVYASGVGILKDIISLIIDPEYGDVTDEEEGLDLIITKTGSGQFNTKYDVKTVRKESPIGFDEWEECLVDLSLLTKAKDYDAIAKIMDGGSVDADEEDIDDSVEDAMSNMPDKTSKEEAPKSSDSDEESDDNDALSDDIKAAMLRRKSKR